MKDKNYRPESPLDELQRLFDLDSETGILKWRVANGKAKAGDVAGRSANSGYILIGINCRNHYAHRIVWRMHHQTDIPPGMRIDHINCVVSDNRPGNLRLATQAQNMANRPGCNRNSSSGIRGVYWVKHRQKWRGVIMNLGKYISTGHFTTKEEAARAVESKRLELFGEFAGRSQLPVKE